MRHGAARHRRGPKRDMAEGRSKTSDQFYKDGTRRWKPNKSWSNKRIRQWFEESPLVGLNGAYPEWDYFQRAGQIETISVYLAAGWRMDHAHCSCNQTYESMIGDFDVYPCDCGLCGGEGNIDDPGDYPDPELQAERRTQTGRFEGYDALVKEWKVWHEQEV